MKTMSSKYAGKCGKCGDTFGPGCRIIWHGRGLPVEHEYCPTQTGGVVGACWECKAPEGRFRQYGAATPVYCDACEAKIRPTTLDWKLRRDNSSHEDRECGDTAYEDRCAAACGF